MAHRLIRFPTLAAWLALALGAIGCTPKQVSQSPTPPPPQTHEQGEPSAEQAGAAGSQGETASSAESDGGDDGGGASAAQGAAAAEGADGGASAGETASAGDPTGSNVLRPSDSAMTPAEERSEADRRLGESLAAFEDRLRRERETLAEASGDSGGAMGGDMGETGIGGGEATGGDTGETSGGGGAAGGDTGETGDRSAGAPAGGPTNDGPVARPGDPPNLPDGSDDDIVAQQLRELAESEEDPEKRAIYWQDYLDYKSGKRSKSGRQDEGANDDGTADDAESENDSGDSSD